VVMKGLAYGGFGPADVSYLDPVAQMDASNTLAIARKSGDAAKIADAQKAYDAQLAEIASHKTAAGQ